MKAETLYDFVDKHGLGGDNLQEFFKEVLGYYSPRGSEDIINAKADKFVFDTLRSETWNSPSLIGNALTAMREWQEIRFSV